MRGLALASGFGNHLAVNVFPRQTLVVRTGGTIPGGSALAIRAARRDSRWAWIASIIAVTTASSNVGVVIAPVQRADTTAATLEH